MRVINWIKRKWYDHKAWQRYKRKVLSEFEQAGFVAIKYRGLPFQPDTLSNSVAELVQSLDEADQQAPIDLQKAKMDIINRKLGKV